MDGDQIAIPIPEGPTAPPPCAWCGDPATKAFTVEPERKSTKKGSAGIVPAKTAPTCNGCYERLTASAQERKSDEGYVVQ